MDPSPEGPSDTAVVLTRRPSRLQIGLLSALCATLLAMTVLSVTGLRRAQRTSEQLLALEYVSRELTDIEVMVTEVHLLSVLQAGGTGAQMDQIRLTLDLLTQKVAAMRVTSEAGGFAEQLDRSLAEIAEMRAVVAGPIPPSSLELVGAADSLRTALRFDLVAQVRPIYRSQGEAAGRLASKLSIFGVLGVAAIALIVTGFVTTRRDIRRNYESGHAALVAHDRARRRAERLNQAQVDISELIASGASAATVVKRAASLLRSLTGRGWIVDLAQPIEPTDGRGISSDEEEILGVFRRLLVMAAERDRLNDLLTRRALHDDLTGLRNRAGLVDRLDHALARRRSKDEALAVLFVDLDRFKQINDSFGHRAGDAVLTTVAARLGDEVRDGDTLARIGGDEFVVVLDGVRPAAIADVADRVFEGIVEPIPLDVGVVSVGASIGVYEVRGDEADPDQILLSADVAMYSAKGSDGGIVVFDESFRDQTERRQATERELRAALDNGELDIDVQPIVSALDGRVVALEAFVRWEHEGLDIPPDEILPLAAETGLIVGIDRYVLHKACTAVSALGREAEELSVSVNFSTRTLARPHAVDTVKDVLAATGLDARRLIIEVEEQSLLDASEHVSVALQSLREYGVRIALDDFGEGRSSVRFLGTMPVDVVKLSGALVSRIEESSTDAMVVLALLALADGLGFEVVAEGVESAPQAQTLADRGCRMLQGFHVAVPVPVDRFELAAKPVAYGPGTAIV